MTLGLSLILCFFASEAFRATWVVEEAGREDSWVVAFEKDVLRVDPEDSGRYFLIKVPSRTVIVVRPEERDFCSVDVEGFRRLVQMGAIEASRFPWVSPVGPDLVENIELKDQGGFSLPDGRKGRVFTVTSETYDRVIAEYRVDLEAPKEIYFQWRTVYGDFWAEGDAEQDRAQEKRLDLYDRLPGVPVEMEERFVLLSRPRSVRLEGLEPAPADWFSVPQDFVEKTASQFLWEDLVSRVERWFRGVSR
jgi:hypothetical protein